MKKIIRIAASLILLQVGLPATAQNRTSDVDQADTGIHFIPSQSWEKLLNKAHQENKIIFIDVYTNWCVPCKKMEKEIFPLKKVRSFFNQNFINYRADAEKGIGKEIAQRFKVHFYPTYLFVNKEGHIVYRGKGYDKNPEKFIDMGRVALKLRFDSLNLAHYKENYSRNQDNKTFIRNYLQLLYRQGLSNNELLDHYVDLLSDREFLDSTHATLIINSVKTSNSKAFQRILQHQDAFANAVSWAKTRFKKRMPGKTPERILGIALEHIIMPDFMNSIFSKNVSLYHTAIHRAYQIKQVGQVFRRQTIPRTKIKFYANMPDTIHLVRVSSQFADSLMSLSSKEIATKNRRLFEEKERKYEQHQMDSTRALHYQKHKSKYKHIFSKQLGDCLWAVAKHYYYLVQDKAKLANALQWSERAVQLDEIPDNRFLYARLLYKLDQKQKAIQEMEAIVKIAKKENKEKKMKTYRKELEKMTNKL